MFTLSRKLFLMPVLACLIQPLLQPSDAKAQAATDDTTFICQQDSISTLDVLLENTTPKKTCSFSKEVVKECLDLSQNSIYAQCNIFKLAINKPQAKLDDTGQVYDSLIFKYSEGNDCRGGNDMMFLGRCDTFAAYIQFIRNTSSGKCYAIANSALLGTQLIEQTMRNSPNRLIRKIEIPGVSRRIIFVPSLGKDFKSQTNFKFLKTANSPKGTYIKPGNAISALSILELENTLTTKPENLKPNPAKIRMTRGEGTGSDFLDFSLGRKEENALNAILQGCS